MVWRVVSLVVGLVACLVSGTLYGIGTWAPAMKNAFGWDQQSINLVGNIGDIGLYLGFTMGLLYDATSPWFTMLVGAVLQGLGYGLMALAVAGYFACPWPLMAFFFFLAGQGSFATYTAGYAPSLYNFGGKHRSRTMSAMVAAFAASSMLFSLVYRFQYRVPINPNDPKDPSVILHLSEYLGVLAATIFGTACACAFFVRKVGPVAETSDARPLLEDTCVDTPPLRLFLNLNFWLCFVSMFLIAGPGLLWMTVQGSIAVSLSEPPSTADNLVLVLGAGSIIGRLATGFASDALVTRTSRALFFIPSAVLMGGSHLVFAFFQHQMLYATCFITGVAYGTAFSVATTVMSALFGKRYCGTNIGIISIAPAVSGIVFGLINGRLYDLQGPNCLGVLCFRNSFVVSGCCALLASVAAVWLIVRTPPYGRGALAAPVAVSVNQKEAQPLLDAKD